jgi:hypothetical protein
MESRHGSIEVSPLSIETLARRIEIAHVSRESCPPSIHSSPLSFGGGAVSFGRCRGGIEEGDGPKEPSPGRFENGERRNEIGTAPLEE